MSSGLLGSPDSVGSRAVARGKASGLEFTPDARGEVEPRRRVDRQDLAEELRVLGLVRSGEAASPLALGRMRVSAVASLANLSEPRKSEHTKPRPLKPTPTKHAHVHLYVTRVVPEEVRHEGDVPEVAPQRVLHSPRYARRP